MEHTAEKHAEVGDYIRLDEAVTSKIYATTDVKDDCIYWLESGHDVNHLFTAERDIFRISDRKRVNAAKVVSWDYLLRQRYPLLSELAIKLDLIESED